VRKTACLLALVWAFLAAPPALAHKMLAVAREHEDGTVTLQAVFPDGKPARGVQVEVHRPDRTLFTTGKTDETGRLTIEPEGAAGRWRAVFTGSMGHATEAAFQVGAVEGEPTAPPLAREAPLVEPEPVPYVEILAGLGFVFGLAAFLMCLKLHGELRRLRGERGTHGEEDA
jgi:hypothetical protein